MSLTIAKGECLGIVGESRLGQEPDLSRRLRPRRRERARLRLGEVQGREVLGLTRKELDSIRGRHVAFVFQDPLTALTPHLTIGRRWARCWRTISRSGATRARARAIEWLERVRIPEAARRLSQYPHELSGGMRQRVMIAMAMMCEPALLIADEPTTALDATVQAQVLDLIEDLRQDTDAAVALITHDMGVIARMAQRVAVMRRGEMVETGGVDEIFAAPKAEYTRMLLEAVPRIDGDARRTTAR